MTAMQAIAQMSTADQGEGCTIPVLRRKLFHRSAQWGRHARGGVLIGCPGGGMHGTSLREAENAFHGVPLLRCGFETWYRVNFGSDSVGARWMAPDTEIIDALPQ